MLLHRRKDARLKPGRNHAYLNQLIFYSFPRQVDEMAKRGHRLVTAQHEAALSTIEWIDSAKTQATYTKV